MVIALTNQSSNSLWGCAGILTGATGDVIGTGETNTNTIVSAGCTTSGSAAELVSNLTLNGYDDWFLPSTDEWAEVYNNLSIIPANNTSSSKAIASFLASKYLLLAILFCLFKLYASF